MKEINMHNFNDHEQRVIEDAKMTLSQNETSQYPHLYTLELPPLLEVIYGSHLQFIKNPQDMDIPLVYVNFVLSQEGIYNIPIPGKVGGGPISQGNVADAFGMALLRASADAVMVGSKTLNTESSHKWHSDFIFDSFAQMENLPHLRAVFTQWRKTLHKEHIYPPTFFMTLSGDIAIDKATVFRDKDIQTFIVTGKEGAEKIRKDHPIYEKEVEMNGQKFSTILEFANETEMMQFLRQKMGIQLLLHEGGQKVIDTLTQKGLITQFFLTRMNCSPNVSPDEFEKAQYFFSSKDHKIPEEAKIISKRIDAAEKAVLYNLDFRAVRQL